MREGRGGRSILDSKQLPRSRNAFERVLAAFGELDTRPHNEVLDGPGDISQGFTGKAVTPGTGAGVIVQVRAVPPGPEPKVADYIGPVSDAIHCDGGQLVTGLNAGSLICLGGAVEDVAIVGDRRFVLVIYLAAGNGATHDQGTALARAVAERL